MNIKKLYSGNGSGHPIYSLEFFPPKDRKLNKVYSALDVLKAFKPDFMSVTCGAMGSENNGTLEIAKIGQNDYGITSAVHMTCVGKSREQLERLIEDVHKSGIRNIVALRGDPPKGDANFRPHPDGHLYASGLISQIKEFSTNWYGNQRLSERFGFGIAAAGYPEGHLECLALDGSRDLIKDMNHLKLKVDAGADVIITQLFLNPDLYFRFVERAAVSGIYIPIVPGVMPSIPKFGKPESFVTKLELEIPKNIQEMLDTHGGESEFVEKYLAEHMIRMGEKLLRGGAPGIHIYTLNNPNATAKFLNGLKGKQD